MATPAGNQSPSAPSPEEASTPTPTSSFPAVANEAKQEPTIFRSLSILDPILQFLTKATGQILVPFGNLETTLPALSKVIPCEDFLCLVRFGILRVEALASGEEASTTALRDDNDYDEAEGKQQDHPRDDLLTNHPWEVVLTNHWGKKQSSSSPSPPTIHVGFPSGDTNKKLCGSTKTAAKRRLAALKRCLKTEEKQKQQSKKKESSNSRQRAAQNKSKCQKADDDKNNDEHDSTKETETAIPENPEGTMQPTNKDWTLPSANEAGETNTEEPLLKTEREARKAFQDVLGLFYDRNSKKNGNDNINKSSKNRNYNIADDLYAPISASSSSFSPTPITNSILPKQLSYAGTQSAQTAGYESYSNEEDRDSRDSDGSVTTSTMTNLLHPIIADAFRLVGYTLKGGENMRQRKQQRNLYKHQALAISSALREDKHTLVCTGTGSGKSLCFLVPVLQRALTLGQKSLLLFPTKALAQDQLVKLQGVLETHPELAKHVSAAALDGDTPHSQRSLVAETCNVIFTNPDTLHASILPNWKTKYKELLRDLKYVVVDEAHMYEGVFGAHVAMILARLYRVHCVCSRLANENHGGNNNNDDDCDSSYSIGGGDGFESENHSHHREDESSSNSISISNCCDRQNAGSLQPLSPPSPSSLVFLACSATLAHPEHHFRLLCCIPSAQPVTVLTEDFSPRAAKHFFVWNPPLLDENGKSLGYVVWPKKQKKKPKKKGEIEGKKENQSTATHENRSSAIPVKLSSVSTEIEEKSRIQHRRKEVRRRHSADETALLLARAVTKGVRCIAFCKTRCLVEWVYERCIKTLKQSKETAGLVSKVDSYRGGYSKLKRREIEEKLFHNQLLGVVGTSALELGVDIGGVGLTLHCGFPSSHASLMQQAGRAGRGVAASHQPSLAICVCFNSPIDQHLWRHPTSLLSRGLSAPLSMPIYPGLVQGHLIW
jgi:DEAD/DEAH box helicase domain-containing protein